MSLSSWLSSILRSAEPKAVKDGISIDGVALTMGQLVSAVKAMPSLDKALVDLYHRNAGLSDWEVIGLDTLAAAAVVDPALAPEISLIAAIAPYLIQGFASGIIKGDPDPIHDAQTTRPFNPGDPAARL